MRDESQIRFFTWRRSEKKTGSELTSSPGIFSNVSFTLTIVPSSLLQVQSTPKKNCYLPRATSQNDRGNPSNSNEVSTACLR